jgi:hypothetical protein
LALALSQPLRAGREIAIRTASDEACENSQKSCDCFGSGYAYLCRPSLPAIAATFLGNIGWIHLGEYQPWLPLIGLEYGFPLGIVIGVIVAAKKDSGPN